jgi:hypothetical protein
MDGTLRPETASAWREEWLSQLLRDISQCTTFIVQLKGAAFCDGLRQEIVATQQKLEGAREEWNVLNPAGQSEAAHALIQRHRPLVLDSKRLLSKAAAMIKEPAKGPAKKNKKEIDNQDGTTQAPNGGA